MKTLLAITIATYVCVGPAIAQQARFGETLRERFIEMGVPGLGFAIVENGRVVESGGLGVVSATSGDPVDEKTPFRIALLTKSLSAALLMKAVRAGGTSLDKPLLEASTLYARRCIDMQAYFKENGLPYLDGVACDDKTITIGHVAMHTATSPPGAAFGYKGYLYGLLSEEIANATGHSSADGFVRAMRAEIIEPLGLANSAAGITDPKGGHVIARLAPPHHREYGVWMAGNLLEEPLNAGAGFIASVADMARIDAAYRDVILDDAVAWDLMTATNLLTDGTRSPYAIGWFIQKIDGRSVVWHYGYQPDAYSALWIKDIANDRSLILLANGDGLASGNDLHRGDLSRSGIAASFLDWSRNPVGHE